MKESDLENASRMFKAKTVVGCDGFHPKVLLDFTKETRGGIVEFLEKVGQSGKWPQQACTTMFFLIPKNVASERPIALVPTMIRWWEAFEGTRSGKVAVEVSCGLGRYGWQKWRCPRNRVGNADGD